MYLLLASPISILFDVVVMMSGLAIIQKLREEDFNKATESKLESHPYLKAAENGTLTLPQRRAFAQEQYSIQLSDAISFAFLAGHKDFRPSSLSGGSITVPDPVARDTDTESSGGQHQQKQVVDLFQFLLGGEIYAAPMLLAYAKTVGLDESSLRASMKGLSSGLDSGDDVTYQISPKAQAYPSYWARLALSGQRAAGAAACAVNFPAWGDMCRRLLEALSTNSSDADYGYADMNDEGLAFIKFFATPIETLDEMASAIIEKEGVAYEDIVEPVRLLQEYEIMFWDAIFETK